MSEEFPPISDELIAQALNTASLPPHVTRVNHYTTDIYEAVDDLKSARRLGEGASDPWSKLRFHLSHAAAFDCWEAFDDFARAWSQKESSLDDPERGPSEFFDHERRPVREPLTFHLILTIRDLQRSLGRAPFRDEILDSIGDRLPPHKGMDEPELSRQLKKLGWSHLIPKKGKNPYPKRPIVRVLSKEEIEKIKQFTEKPANFDSPTDS